MKRFFEHLDTLPYGEVIYLVEGGEPHDTYVFSVHKTKDEAIEAAMRRASQGSDDEVFSVIAYLVGVEQVICNNFVVWNYYWDVKRRRNE